MNLKPLSEAPQDGSLILIHQTQGQVHPLRRAQAHWGFWNGHFFVLLPSHDEGINGDCWFITELENYTFSNSLLYRVAI